MHIKQLFDELQAEYPEKVGGRDAYVVLAKRHGRQPVKFYFDERTGLLLRKIHYAESPLGSVPTQIDYSDYRNAGGVQVPFRLMIARADGTVTIQWQRIQQNISINNVRFSEPTASSANDKKP